MIWLLITIAVLLALILWELSAGLAAIRRIQISASDLNLKAHAQLLDHFEQLQRDRAHEDHIAFMERRN